MKKLFVSALTVFALTSVAISPAFAEQELETIVVRGQRSGCSGACAQNFLSEMRDAASRIFNDFLNADTVSPDSSGEAPKNPEPLVFVRDVDPCQMSSSQRTAQANAQMSNGFAGQSFPVGTVVSVVFGEPGRAAFENYQVIRDTSSNSPSGMGTLEPVAGSFHGCE